MKKVDSNTHLEELKTLVIKFRAERGWDKHFTPKNVATSIAIEAAELLELFQWDLLMKEDRQKAAEELADVLIFAFHFATIYDIDITTAFRAKLEAAAKKYPISVFNPQSDSQEEYHAAKQAYRKAK